MSTSYIDLVLFERRRRWLIPAQGWSASDNPGFAFLELESTLKGFDTWRTLFQGLSHSFDLIPGLSLRSNPGLELANAFGGSN